MVFHLEEEKREEEENISKEKEMPNNFIYYLNCSKEIFEIEMKVKWQTKLKKISEIHVDTENNKSVNVWEKR